MPFISSHFLLLIIKSASLSNVRCYASETLVFHPGFNLICGENGQGKTNLLEAVYMLCRFKPMRGASASEVVRFGAETAVLSGVIEKGAPPSVSEIRAEFRRGGKRIEVNGKRPASLAKKALDFEVVHFTPQEVELAKGSPSLRRRYFDSIICGLAPSHFQDILDFQRVVRQRNSALASGRATARAVEPWDDRIAAIGGRIVEKRMRLTDRINGEIADIYGRISGNGEAAKAVYEPSCEVSGSGRVAYEDSIRKTLKSRLSRDMALKYTSAGPHRDRISLQIGGRDCVLYASQGEARSVVLAMKIAEIRLYQRFRKENPVFLLDDISSELDAKRRKFLFEMLMGYPGQIFVTSTSASDILYAGKRKTFQISGGRVVGKG